jgi:hypothetical protein
MTDSIRGTASLQALQKLFGWKSGDVRSNIQSSKKGKEIRIFFSRHSEKILTVTIIENVQGGHSHQAPI